MDETTDVRALLAEPALCDGCPHAPRCAAGMACEQFRAFSTGLSATRWQVAPRQPSADIYADLFAEAHAARVGGR